jgi:CDP-diacylglycerol--glycerol-3-phosphate 3-phosphatidyltransferase
MQNEHKARWWTLANGLTSLRFVLGPVCALALLNDRAELALPVFVVAILTDMLDGRIARRGGDASSEGALFDHATDAWFVCLGLLALAIRGLVPIALPLLIALAFAQYTLDSRALAGQQLRASWLGRRNGIAYWVLLAIPIARDAGSLGWPSDALFSALATGLALTTAISIGDRAMAWGASRRGRRSLEAPDERRESQR